MMKQEQVERERVDEAIVRIWEGKLRVGREFSAGYRVVRITSRSCSSTPQSCSPVSPTTELLTTVYL